MNAFHRLQLGLHHADQIVCDIVGGQGFAGKSDDHRTYIFAGGDRNHRLLRVPGQLVEHGVDLGVDFGERHIGVVIEAHVRSNSAHALRAG